MADVVVIGAGIFGLSVAYALKHAGATVEVLDAEGIGSGASGGVVGALCPHAPTRWRPFKQFQLDALVALPRRIEEIEAASGLGTGYAQTGRVTPLASERDRTRAEAEALGAREIWGADLGFDILDEVPAAWSHWVSDSAAAAGFVHETLSARVDPRAYVTALARAVGTVREGVHVTRILAPGDGVASSQGDISADHIVIAAGWQSWDLLGELALGLCGQPVKGQAAVLGCDAGKVPLIYNDGLYAIPHGAGRVAIGSTSEKMFEGSGTDTDGQLDAVIEKARRAVPALREAPVLARWAGLRPKPPGREPVVGPLPDRPDILLATGGFKISFGIAHAIGDAVAAEITGNPAPIPLPETFDPAHLLHAH